MLTYAKSPWLSQPLLSPDAQGYAMEISVAKRPMKRLWFESTEHDPPVPRLLGFQD